MMMMVMTLLAVLVMVVVEVVEVVEVVVLLFGGGLWCWGAGCVVRQTYFTTGVWRGLSTHNTINIIAIFRGRHSAQRSTHQPAGMNDKHKRTNACNVQTQNGAMAKDGRKWQ